MTNDSVDGIPSPKPPPTWAIALAFAVVFYSWGTTYRATSIAMRDEHMPPALFGGVRLGLAGTILLVCQFGRGQSLRLSGRQFLRLILVSWFYFLSANYLISLGQQREDSGVAAILIATTPLWMGLFGMFWPQGDGLSWRGWLGLLIGFAGIVLTKLDDGLDLVKDYSALFILVLVFGSLLRFVAFNWLLGHINVAKVGTYAYVNPVIAVFIGWCAGEAVPAWILAGIAVILVGVYLVRGDRAPSREIELEPD